MSRWQRPSSTPIPLRQAAADRVRRTDPRRVARHVLIAAVAVLLAQLGWHWRTTTMELGERRTLVVMEAPVAAGESVTSQDIRLVSWPIGLAPDGAVPTIVEHTALGTIEVVIRP